MSPIEHLSPELFAAVLDLVATRGVKSLNNVALVHSTWHHATKYIRSRHIHLDLRPEHLASTKAKLSDLDSSGLLGAIRTIQITGYPKVITWENPPWEWPEYNKVTFFLCDLLPRMTALEIFWWTPTAVPTAVLEALSLCPSVKIGAYIRYEAESFSALCGSNLERLQNNQNLWDLKVFVSVISQDEWEPIRAHLKQVILTARNLKHLTLRLSTCSVSAWDEPQYVDFSLGFGATEIPPDLQTFCFPGTFEFKGRLDSQGNQTDYWWSSLRWSQLKQISCRDESALLKSVDQLTGLRELYFRRRPPSRQGRQNLNAFFTALPSNLEVIRMHYASCITSSILPRHGQTLRKLQVARGNHNSWDFYADVALSKYQVTKLEAHCPVVEELDIDFSRNGDGSWRYECFQSLARLPRLETLILRLDTFMPTKNKDLIVDIATPALTYSSTVHILEYLLEHGARSLRLLQMSSCTATWSSGNETDLKGKLTHATKQTVKFDCERKEDPFFHPTSPVEKFWIRCVGMNNVYNEALATDPSDQLFTGASFATNAQTPD